MRRLVDYCSMPLGGTVCAFLFVEACQADPLERLPEPARVGDHLRFYADENSDLVMCEGSLAYMDRYLHELISIRGEAPDHVVDYYWLPTNTELIEEICPTTGGCTLQSGTIITPFLPHEHELVHAAKVGPRFHMFLEEGIAEVWGSHTDWAGDYSLSVEAGIGAPDPLLPAPYYGIAGRFAAFMLLDFGTDALVEVGELAGEGASLAQVDDAFEEVLGMSVSAVALAYEESNWRCQRSVYRDDSITCGIARELNCDLADENGVLSIDFDLDCASEHFVGPRDGVVWSDVTFPAGNRAVHVYFGADEEDFGTVTLRRCDVGCADPINPITITPNQDYTLLGDYEGLLLLRVELPADGKPRGTATLEVWNVCDPP